MVLPLVLSYPVQALIKKHLGDIPSSFVIALGVALAFMAFIAWDQSHWWSEKEDYGFGWLVPAFVAYVIHDRWGRITAALQVCAAPGSGRAEGVAKWGLRLGLVGLVMFGGFFFLLGAFFKSGAGPSYPGTLAITMGGSALMLALFFLNTPDSPSPTATGWRGDARLKVVGLFIFPALVWLVSAPMVSAVENNLSLFLLNKVTVVVFFVFEMLGYPIEQQGNVLLLPLGQVGVADACSGIRSLTGCLFAGSFLAAVFLEKLWKKIALVACSMLFAFFTNLLRSLFLTAWAYNYGPEAIEGTVHDVAGYAVLGLTVIGLLCLLPLFNLKIRFSSPDEAKG